MISPGGSKGAFFRQMFDTVFVMLFLSSCAQGTSHSTTKLPYYKMIFKVVVKIFRFEPGSALSELGLVYC